MSESRTALGLALSCIFDRELDLEGSFKNADMDEVIDSIEHVTSRNAEELLRLVQNRNGCITKHVNHRFPDTSGPFSRRGTISGQALTWWPMSTFEVTDADEQTLCTVVVTRELRASSMMQDGPPLVVLITAGTISLDDLDQPRGRHVVLFDRVNRTDPQFVLANLERAHLMGCSNPDDPTKRTLYGDAAKVIRKLIAASDEDALNQP